MKGNPSELVLSTSRDSFNLDRVFLGDGEAKREVNREVNKEGFMEELRAAFARLKAIENLNDVQIVKMAEAKGVNNNSHFIATHGDKKYHIKAALHGMGISLGSKFNEIAHYKLNEKLGIGPRCDGILTPRGVLMIVTEDLSTRSIGAAQGKTITFSDNEERDAEGNIRKKGIAGIVPDRHRDNVHRCATEIAINLLFYADVQRNFGNTGFKTTVTESGGEKIVKQKPFIVDFRLSNTNDLMKKYLDSSEVYREISMGSEVEKYAETIGLKLEGEVESGPIKKDVFEFDESPEVFKDALKKLFLEESGEPTKFQRAIRESFGYAKDLVLNSQSRAVDNEQHVEALTLREKLTLSHVNDTFLVNPKIIKSLSEQVQKNMKEGGNPREQTSQQRPSGTLSNPEAVGLDSKEEKTI
jgi:hypothetical protein